MTTSGREALARCVNELGDTLAGDEDDYEQLEEAAEHTHDRLVWLLERGLETGRPVSVSCEFEAGGREWTAEAAGETHAEATARLEAQMADIENKLAGRE